MRIEFDPAKDDANRSKHGVSLGVVGELEWSTALVWPDVRHVYGEPRQCALALLGERLYFVAFVDRLGVRRPISMRRAHNREVMRYVENA